MYQKVCCTCKAVVLILAAVVVTVSRSPQSYSPFVLICSNIAFSLTWPASMQVHWNKRKRLHKKRVRLPQDWFGTPTWPPFHCFGTPIWPPWRHVKKLYIFSKYDWTLLLQGFKIPNYHIANFCSNKVFIIYLHVVNTLWLIFNARIVFWFYFYFFHSWSLKRWTVLLFFVHPLAWLSTSVLLRLWKPR